MPYIVDPPPAVPGALLDSTLTDLAFDYLPEYVRSDDDGTLYGLLGAVCSQADRSVAWLSDPAAVADPWQAAPSQLAWLAAVSGVDLTGVPNDNRRAFIAEPLTRNRGSLAALQYRVGQTLTGAKAVEVVCPYLGDVNRISVTTYASQTPDPAATTAAIRAEIPAWMKATIVTNAAGQPYSNMAADYATYAAMAATGKTYGTLSQEV